MLGNAVPDGARTDGAVTVARPPRSAARASRAALRPLACPPAREAPRLLVCPPAREAPRPLPHERSNATLPTNSVRAKRRTLRAPARAKHFSRMPGNSSSSLTLARSDRDLRMRLGHEN